MNRLSWSRITALSLSLWATLSLAESTAERQLDEAVAGFLQAEGGDTLKIEAAERKFAELSLREPDNPVYQAYHGSAMALLSRTTLVPWKKIGHVKDGIAELDAMLKNLKPKHDQNLLRGVPQSLEAKLVAAGTFLTVPSLFGRYKDGVRLLEEIQQAKPYVTTPAQFKAEVLLRVADIHKEEGRPQLQVEFVNKALALDPSLAGTERIRAALTGSR